MAFDFPSAPLLDQEFIPIPAKAYVWNGEAWRGKPTIEPVAPAPPFPEAPADGKVYGRQGLTASWVEVAPNLPRPTVTSVAPASVDNANAPETVTVTGADFDVSSEVYLWQNAMPTTFVSATQVTFQTVAGMTVGTYPLTVVSAGLAAIPTIDFVVT